MTVATNANPSINQRTLGKAETFISPELSRQRHPPAPFCGGEFGLWYPDSDLPSILLSFFHLIYHWDRSIVNCFPRWGRREGKKAKVIPASGNSLRQAKRWTEMFSDFSESLMLRHKLLLGAAMPGTLHALAKDTATDAVLTKAPGKLRICVFSKRTCNGLTFMKQARLRKRLDSMVLTLQFVREAMSYRNWRRPIFQRRLRLPTALDSKFR